MIEKELQFIDGFAHEQFIDYLQTKHNFDSDSFAIDLIQQLIEYGRKYHKVSKDQLAYFLTDIIPDLDFYEAAAFFEDKCLTQNGQTEKQRFWQEAAQCRS